MSLFSARHYRWLADAAATLRNGAPSYEMYGEMVIDQAVERLADLLEADSPGFNRKLFLANYRGEPAETSSETDETETD